MEGEFKSSLEMCLIFHMLSAIITLTVDKDTHAQELSFSPKRM